MFVHDQSSPDKTPAAALEASGVSAPDLGHDLASLREA